MSQVGRVASPEANHDVARLSDLLNDCNDLLFIPDRKHGCVPRASDSFREGFMVDTIDRRLTRRVERRDDDGVCTLERCAEILKQVAYACVPVWLYHGNHAAAGSRPGCLENGSDFGWVVAIVIKDENAIPRTSELKSPLHAA